jgi:hypothetical protein
MALLLPGGLAVKIGVDIKPLFLQKGFGLQSLAKKSESKPARKMLK